MANGMCIPVKSQWVDKISVEERASDRVKRRCFLTLWDSKSKSIIWLLEGFVGSEAPGQYLASEAAISEKVLAVLQSWSTFLGQFISIRYQRRIWGRQSSLYVIHSRCSQKQQGDLGDKIRLSSYNYTGGSPDLWSLLLLSAFLHSYPQTAGVAHWGYIEITSY